MTTFFNEWFPTSRHGDPAINVMDFGAIADGVGHPLYTLFAGGTSLAEMQETYPSATSTDDYADWCALTEAIKAAFSTDGVKHGGEGFKNRPLRIPAGQYIINKPVRVVDVSQALIYGTGNGAKIYNENSVEPDNMALMFDGFNYSRVENLQIGAVGPNCLALDINKTAAATLVNTNSNVWINVNCSAIGTNGIGTYIGRGGIMCSEQTFIRCQNDSCAWGWIISNDNALSYLFLTSGGTDNTEACIRINTGGSVTCINCFFAANAVDIDNYAGSPVTCISCRSESNHFIRGGYNSNIIGCTISNYGSEIILAESSGQVFISGTDCAQARLVGEGDFHILGGLSQHATHFISGVSNSGGLVKITHPVFEHPGVDHWRNGDQVKIYNVVGTTNPTAPSVNGIWIINKLNSTSFELIGSTYVADTYTITDARMAPGPQYATMGLNFAVQMPVAYRPLGRTFIRDGVLQWTDSGSLVTNSGSAGAVTLTLPDAGDTHWKNCRGTSFRFVVIAAQSLTVVRAAAGSGPPVRIYRAGAYATGGTQISSNVEGNSIELMLVDGQGAGPIDTTVDAIGHRWLVISEGGTWTLSGTP